MFVEYFPEIHIYFQQACSAICVLNFTDKHEIHPVVYVFEATYIQNLAPRKFHGFSSEGS